MALTTKQIIYLTAVRALNKKKKQKFKKKRGGQNLFTGVISDPNSSNVFDTFIK